MNKRIKELAEQCWDRRLDGVHFDQEKFANLVAENEREACAKIVENYCGAWDDQGYALAAAIRARGEK